MRYSTLLLIVLIIVISVVSSNAQEKFDSTYHKIIRLQGKTTATATGNFISPTLSIGVLQRIVDYRENDTIKSYLLVTMPIDECSGDCLITKRIIGYEVIDYNPIKNINYAIAIYYLDEDKKPLPKSYNIWMSKPVNK